MLDVEEWADLRRQHFVGGISIKELSRRSGFARNTVRTALRSEGQPRYARAPAPSKLDPFKEEIHRLLGEEPKLPATRVRELIEPLGFEGRQTIVDVYVREVRPLFLPLRTFQRTRYRPGEIAQFDLLEPRREIPVGFGQTRKGYVLACVLGFSRVSGRCADLLEGRRGHPGRAQPLPVAPRGPARDACHRPRGIAARRRRASV